MRKELNSTILYIFKDVTLDEALLRGEWKAYIAKVISSLRNGYAWWQGFDESFHKTTNALYYAVYQAVYNHVRHGVANQLSIASDVHENTDLGETETVDYE